MSYTDLTAVWAYKGPVLWKNMDAHAVNSDILHQMLENKYAQTEQGFSGAQSISNGTWTKLVFDQEVFDPSGVMSTSRFSPVATGLYLAICGCLCDHTADVQGTIQCAIYKNGSEFKRGDWPRDHDVTANLDAKGLCMCLVELTSLSDYLEAFVWQSLEPNPAGARNTAQTGLQGDPHFSVFRMGV